MALSTRSCAGVLGHHDPHVDIFLDLREQQRVIVQPRQTGGVFEPAARLPIQYRNDPRIPLERLIHGIGDPRAIGRKHGVHLAEVVACELHGFTVGKELDVDLSGPNERLWAANECQHAAVR